VGATLDSLVVDCADPLLAARFWSAALEWNIVDEEDDVVEIADPSGLSRPVLFVVVPEPKSVKNRLHMDIRPSGSMKAEVTRLESAGATRLRRVDEGGSFWTVMSDPEGNEFCVLRSEAERPDPYAHLVV
jgi:predicted enzyme related to lactoylglutathione lyase